MILPLIITIAVLALFLIIDSKNPLISNVFLFMLFWFAYANMEKDVLSTFYLFGIVFVMIVTLTKQRWAPALAGDNAGGFKIGRIAFPVVGILIGVGIYIFMLLLQGSKTTSIIGVPALSIASTLGGLFGPALAGILGVVENRVFFSIFELLRLAKIHFYLLPLIPIIGPVMALALPFIITCTAFALFHLSAYGVAASAFIFAFMVMGIWLGVYLVRRDDTHATISHYLWNSFISLSRSLKVI